MILCFIPLYLIIGIQTLNKLIEQYKNKAIELETSTFELQSSLQTKEQIIIQLNNEIERNKNNKNIFIDEINSLKLQIQHYEVQASLLNDVNDSGGGDLNDKNHDNNHNYQFNDNNHNDEIMMLKNELNDVRHIKREREDMLLQSKKYIEELKYEIEKLKEQYHQQVTSHTNTSSSTTNTTTSSSNDNNDNKNIMIIKELNQKLSETFNTIKLLTDSILTALERSITDSILNTIIASPSNNLTNNNNISTTTTTTTNSLNNSNNNSNSIKCIYEIDYFDRLIHADILRCIDE